MFCFSSSNNRLPKLTYDFRVFSFIPNFSFILVAFFIVSTLKNR